MGKRLFITGGTGFFGKSMLDYRLRHPDWEWASAEWVVLSRSPERFRAEYPALAGQKGVSFISGDIRDFAFPEGRFDAVLHAATSALTTMSDDEMSSVIIDGTRRVVDFSKAAGGAKVLFASSGAVYGPRTSPAAEDDPCLPATAYGKGKLAAEKMLAESGLDVKLARCFAFVGPYLNRRIHYAIGNFIQDCIDGRSIVIKGDGTPLRSYLYADDLVEWLFAILERGNPGRVYNVGSDQSLSIRRVAECVRSALQSDVDIKILSPAPQDGDVSVYVPDVGRAKNELGLDVRVDLETAIKKSI